MHRVFANLVFAAALSSSALAQTVDTVGGASNLAVNAGLAKGNAYQVATSVNLTQAEFHWDSSNAETLTFTVHSCATEFGFYDEVFRSSTQVTGTGAG